MYDPGSKLCQGLSLTTKFEDVNKLKPQIKHKTLSRTNCLAFSFKTLKFMLKFIIKNLENEQKSHILKSTVFQVCITQRASTKLG